MNRPTKSLGQPQQTAVITAPKRPSLNYRSCIFAVLLFVRLLHKLQIEGAWLAAAIFALHPVHVESVAWMVEIKNTLSGVFFLGCVLLYLRFLENRNWSTYGFLVIIFTLGVLSKAIVAAFPIVVLVLLWWKRGRLT